MFFYILKYVLKMIFMFSASFFFIILYVYIIFLFKITLKKQVKITKNN